MDFDRLRFEVLKLFWKSGSLFIEMRSPAFTLTFLGAATRSRLARTG
jgi:hypothetical protein